MARAKKTEKKKWFPILAPKLFHNQVVGEILLTNPSDAIGRSVPVNLANLIRDPRRQNITIKLKAISVAGEKIHTELTGYEISPSFIKKTVRKGGTKIDYTFSVETADEKNIRLKIVISSRRNINVSVATALRKTAEDILKREIKKSSFAELMQEVVSHKLQSNLKRQLAKVYPLKVCEIRCLIIEKSKRAFEEEKPPLKVKEVETEEKKEIKTPEAEKPSKKEPEKKEEKTEIKAEEKKE